LLAALAAALGWWLHRPAPAPGRGSAVPTRTAIVRAGAVEQTLRITGATGAVRFTALLAPRMRGSRGQGHGPSDFLMILKDVVKPGIHVRQGDVVAEFDRQYMLNRLEDYKAWVVQHEISLQRLRALLDVRRAGHRQKLVVAKGALEKAALELKKNPILSAIQAERNRLLFEEAQAHYQQLLKETEFIEISEGAAIRRSEADLRQSQLELRRAENNAGRMLVKAPMDGLAVMLTTRRGSEYAQIEAGDQLHAGQPYMQIVDRSSMVVNAILNQVDVDGLRLGLTARVRFDAYPGLELPARLIAIGTMARGTGWRGQYVKEVPVRLRLEQTDPRVIPDLSVSADLLLAATPAAAVVPRECVFADASGAFAWVRAAHGWQKRRIELGPRSHVVAAVRQGLRPGDVVAAEAPESAPAAEAR
jgi:multidrug efflux pump subunit AcrA (membrane-fusion protein)